MKELKLPNSYFPHDFNARYDRKILRVRKVLGLEGYGIYWMLIETLCTQEGFSYPIKDIDLLADDFGCSNEKIEAVVKQFDLFQISEDATFFSFSLITRLQKYLDISESARQNANKRWQKARLMKENAGVLPEQSEGNANNRIEYERIENDILSVWNEFAFRKGLAQVKVLTDKRKVAVRHRIEEKTFNLKEILKKISESEFLLGLRKGSEWKASFDFVFCSRNNYIKILEGNYNNGKEHKKELLPHTGRVITEKETEDFKRSVKINEEKIARSGVFTGKFDIDKIKKGEL